MPLMMGLLPRRLHALMVITALGTSSLTAACVPTGKSGPGSQLAANDPCAADRQQLTAIGDYFGEAMVTGAVAGAALGALSGALIGGDTKSALIGAGVGAVAGAAAGYWQAKSDATSDRTQLVRGVYKDIAAENQQIDKTSTILWQLRSCRMAEADHIRADYKNRRISADQARSQLTMVKDKFAWEVDYAAQITSEVDDRGSQYAYAAQQISSFDPASQRPTADYQPTGPLLYLVAAQSTRVRERPEDGARQIGGLKSGEKVEARAVDGGGGRWMRVRLADGTPGYVAASTLVSPAQYQGTVQAVRSRAEATARMVPPQNAKGVASLAETNQLKQKSLKDDVDESRSLLTGSTFDLDQPISRDQTPASRQSA